MKFITRVKLYSQEAEFTFKSPGRLDMILDGDFIRLNTIAGATYLIVNQRELSYIVLNEEIPTV